MSVVVVREKPYKATGLSWYLTDDDMAEDERFGSVLAMIDVLRAEVIESGSGHERHVSRLGSRARSDSSDELNRRLSELTREFQERSPEPGGSRSASSSRCTNGSGRAGPVLGRFDP